MTHSTTDRPTLAIDTAAIDSFCSHLTTWGHSHHTVRAYKTDLMMLLEDRPAITVPTFSDTAADWITENKDHWSASTTNRRLASFNRFAKWLDIPGLQGYRRPRVIHRPKVRIGMTEVLDVLTRIEAGAARGLTSAERRDTYAMVSLCGGAGVRVHEAQGATLGDISPAAGNVMALMVHGKGGKDRVVPYPQRMYEVVTNFPGAELHDVPTAENARWLIRKAFKMCGYGRVESHDLRHAYATALYDDTGDIVLVQKMLGHSDIKTTMQYIDRPFELGADFVGGLS